MRYDGNKWASSALMLNTGTNIGIGESNPQVFYISAKKELGKACTGSGLDDLVETSLDLVAQVRIAMLLE